MHVFLDTNILLSFYHLSGEDLEELRKLSTLIEQGRITLWLPDQVRDEFLRNRDNKVVDAIAKFREEKLQKQFPQICKDYEEYAGLRELQGQYQKQRETLISKLQEDAVSGNFKADGVIRELLEKATLVDSAPYVELARVRAERGNPPGKNTSVRDGINWETLLASVPDREDLHCIADDSDYRSVLVEDLLHPFLEDEWVRRKKSSIHYYRRISSFFKEHFGSIRLAAELEKEHDIRKLVHAGSFAATHAAIARLTSYEDFSPQQVEQLAAAALSNSQITWILEDPDVFEFYDGLLTNYGSIIEENVRAELDEELSTIRDRRLAEVEDQEEGELSF